MTESKILGFAKKFARACDFFLFCKDTHFFINREKNLHNFYLPVAAVLQSDAG